MSGSGKGKAGQSVGASDAPPKKTSRRPCLSVLQEVIFARAGIVSSVAEALKVAPRTVRRWRDGDLRVLEMFHEAKEAVLDLAEAEVVKGIRRGVPSDRYFFLKCHGRSRGWIERQEMAVRNEGLPPSESEWDRRNEITRKLLADPEARELAHKLLERYGRIRKDGGEDAGEDSGGSS